MAKRKIHSSSLLNSGHLILMQFPLLQHTHTHNQLISRKEKARDYAYHLAAHSIWEQCHHCIWNSHSESSTTMSTVCSDEYWVYKQKISPRILVASHRMRMSEKETNIHFGILTNLIHTHWYINKFILM